MQPNLTVIILTFNEEENIAQALESVCDWANQVFILDSLSTDRTLDIARKYNCTIFQNTFEDYAKQRNYALKHLPIKTDWVLFLDADEWLPNPLKEEITELLNSKPQENGFYIKMRFVWMGQWIRRGYYPTWLLRLFRNGKASCEERAINEHLIVEGALGYLKNDFVHQNRKRISDWISKHNVYSTMEAEELLKNSAREKHIEAYFWGTQTQRKRWLRHRVWIHLPPLIRPFVYFFYRYFLKGGFLDGQAGFSYHFLQALWFPLLIDIKYLEMKLSQRSFGRTDESIIRRG